jgi:putative molybdopterin biosynthesis protein
MSVYLHDIPLPEAKSVFENALRDAGLRRVLGKETIPLDEAAVGRVLAEPVWARLSSPNYHAAAMDGFAVRAEETAGADPTNPIALKISSQAQYVDTGDPLPLWANCVIPIEEVEAHDEQGRIVPDAHHPQEILVRAGSTPWKHVRTMGEDIVATQLILPSGHSLRPYDLGAIAAGGFAEVVVARKPVVTIIPTGTELVPIGTQVQHGDIIEFNSLMLAAQVNSWGGKAQRREILPDNFEIIRTAVQTAAEESDLILLNAGSSAGSEDFSASVVQTLGDLLVHGIAVRPGHPVILGMISCVNAQNNEVKKVPIVGVPGYPVSAALTGEIFVEHLIAEWLGRAPLVPEQVKGTLTRKITSPPGDDDYVRVVVGKVGDHLKVAPITRGAGVITSLVRADGIVIIPRSIQGLEAGAEVSVRLYRTQSELNKTIFAIGSHDMTLDLVSQYLASKDRRLVSANVGSQGGLVALRRGEAHLAGSHLLDPVTGEYNLSYIRQYLPETAVKVVTWVEREQGLLVKKGNPKKILSIEDVAREDMRIVNRQRGAGTRVLLDFLLKNKGIQAEKVRGYELEEFTHLSVAAAIASDRADCGLGIAAAARALDLDFIPIFMERYDFVIPCRYLEGDLLAPLFDLMTDVSFKQAVSALSGYNIRDMGKIVQEC